jgi:hypothetical protein
MSFMVPKGTLCALLLLVQVLALAACARATPTPLVPENVRQQVVGAMQRDGRLTKVDVRIVGPGNVGVSLSSENVSLSVQ